MNSFKNVLGTAVTLACVGVIMVGSFGGMKYIRDGYNETCPTFVKVSMEEKLEEGVVIKKKAIDSSEAYYIMVQGQTKAGETVDETWKVSQFVFDKVELMDVADRSYLLVK